MTQEGEHPEPGLNEATPAEGAGAMPSWPEAPQPGLPQAETGPEIFETSEPERDHDTATAVSIGQMSLADAFDATSRFEATLYRALNPDVAAAVSRGQVDARQHWIDIGRAEYRAGMRPSLAHQLHLAPPHAARREEAEVSSQAMSGFDAAGYGFLNKDLPSLISQDAEAARTHWLQAGLAEGRVAPGWRPNAGRQVSFAQLMARTRGIDLYAPFGDSGPLGRLARRLAFALSASGLSYELYPYHLSGGVPRIPAIDRTRSAGHRVSLLLCEPRLLQALVENWPHQHFASSYVIGIWPGDWREAQRNLAPADGAVDEVWVADEAAAAALGPYVGAPVHAIGLPVGEPVSPSDRDIARSSLELASDTTAVLFCVGDALPTWSDRAMIDVARAQLRRVIDAVYRLSPEVRARLLILAPGEPLQAAFNDLLGEISDDRIRVVSAPEHIDDDLPLQAAADVLISHGDGMAAELRAAAFRVSGRPVIGINATETDRLALTFSAYGDRHFDVPVFRPASLAAVLSEVVATGPVMPASGAGLEEQEARFIDALAARVEGLGLNTEPLAFTRSFGVGSELGQPTIFAGLPPRSRDRIERLVHRPFFDVVVIAERARIDPDVWAAGLRSLQAQRYALRRIHLAIATDGSQPEIAREPGLLLPRPGLDLRQALEEAIASCSGSHIVLCEAGTIVRPWALIDFALAADSRPETSFYGDGEVEGRPIHRAATPRLTTALDVGPILSIPHRVLAGLTPLSGGEIDDPLFTVAARLIGKSLALELIDETLSIAASARRTDTQTIRAEVMASIAVAEGARVLTDPRNGIARLAPSLDRLAPVTIVLTAADAGEVPLVSETMRTLGQTRYGNLTLMLVADPAAVQALDRDAMRQMGVSILTADADGQVAPLRQRGLISAATPLVAFLDAGATFAPDWLSELAEPTLSTGFGASGVRIAAGGQTPEDICSVTAVDGACLLVDRVAAIDAGGFQPALHQGADTGLCLSLREAGARIVVVPGAGVDLPAPVNPDEVIGALRDEWGDLVADDLGRVTRPQRRRRQATLPPRWGATAHGRPAAVPAQPSLAQEHPASARPVTEHPIPPASRGTGWRRSV